MKTQSLTTHDSAHKPKKDPHRKYKDPVDFVRVFLNEKPWQKQRQILNALRDHNRVAVRSCNASGKTYTAALATIWWLMAHEEALVITTAPTQRQVKHTLWREIRDIYDRNKELIGGKLTSTRLELSNKRYAYGFSTNTAERFQGFHNENILIIIDEASGVREFVYDAILGLLTSGNAKVLMIGNPSSLAGTYYDAFHKNRKHWKTVHIAADDTPNIKLNLEPSDPRYIRGGTTTEWAKSVLDLKGKRSASYQIRVQGEFPDEADDTLIPLHHIENAVDRLFEDLDQHEAVMGLDVARFGDDQTVAIVRRGNAVVDLVSHRKSDLMNTTGRALEIGRNHDVKTINVDEVGLGSAVVDRIAELTKSKEVTGINAVGVNGGKKAETSEKFSNLRAQMFDGLRQRFADGDISIPNDPELISQLASTTYSYNSRGQLQIETKQQIRDSGRQSPDKADALALAFTTPTPPPNAELRMWIGTPERTAQLQKLYQRNPRARRRGWL